MSAVVVVHDGFGRVIRENNNSPHKIARRLRTIAKNHAKTRRHVIRHVRQEPKTKKPLSLAEFIRRPDFYYFYLAPQLGANTPNFGAVIGTLGS